MDLASCAESGMARRLFEMRRVSTISGRALHLFRTRWENLLQARLCQVRQYYHRLYTIYFLSSFETLSVLPIDNENIE